MSPVWFSEDPTELQPEPLTRRALASHTAKSAVLTGILIPLTILVASAVMASLGGTWGPFLLIIIGLELPVMVAYALPFGVILSLLIGRTRLGTRRAWSLATGVAICVVAGVGVLILIRTVGFGYRNLHDVVVVLSHALSDPLFTWLLWLTVPLAAVEGLWLGHKLGDLRRESSPQRNP